MRLYAFLLAHLSKVLSSTLTEQKLPFPTETSMNRLALSASASELSSGARELSVSAPFEKDDGVVNLRPLDDDKDYLGGFSQAEKKQGASLKDVAEPGPSKPGNIAVCGLFYGKS